MTHPGELFYSVDFGLDGVTPRGGSGVLKETSGINQSIALLSEVTDCCLLKKLCYKIGYNIDRIANMQLTLTEWGIG